MIEKELLNILVCPKTGARLIENPSKRELVCFVSKLAYPVEKGVPVLLISEAREVLDEELEGLKGELL